jgi:glycine/D-amino acid oxidase-like deaminating enzyme
MAEQEALEAHYRARSLWLDGIPEPLTPRLGLGADADCDVAIVGAGFTGLWTAYYLKQHQPGLRVVVVEREIAGYGPSGRNGGAVGPGFPGSFAAYGIRDGDESVLRAIREAKAVVDEVGRVIADEGIECGYLKAGGLVVATTEPQRARLLARPAGLYDQDDDELLLEPGKLAELVRIPGVLASRFSPHAARVDPARLVRGLANVCERLGVTIHERTAALDLAPGRVRCAAGTLRADTVVRATESYTSQLPGQRLRYLTLYSLMIATEPLPPEVWEQLGWRDGLEIEDLHHLFFYAQRTMDGRIAIGGRGAPYRLRRPLSEANERSEAVAQRLGRSLRRHFPAAAAATITHHWGGPLASRLVDERQLRRTHPPGVGRRLHRLGRCRVQHRRPHARGPRARSRHRPGEASLGPAPQSPMGARATPIPGVERDRARARPGRPQRGSYRQAIVADAHRRTVHASPALSRVHANAARAISASRRTHPTLRRTLHQPHVINHPIPRHHL